MTYRFLIHKVNNGMYKDFSFSDTRRSIVDQIHSARFAIAGMYGIHPQDVEPIDFSYGKGEWIKI